MTVRTSQTLAMVLPVACACCGGTSKATSGTDASAGAGGQLSESGASGSAPVNEFLSSGCVEGTAAAPQWLTGFDAGQYVALQCIAWDLTSPERILLDLGNFPEDAGFPNPVDNLWVGAAEWKADGTLSVTVQWDFEYQNSGGYCLQNFSFEIEGEPADDRLPLEIATRPCTGACSWERYEVNLPVGTEPTGVLCRYSAGLARSEDLLGTLHYPPAEGACNGDLVAVQVEQGWEVCAEQCSEDGATCALPGLFECRESACVIADPW